VDRLEGFVLLWKRGETILAVGERVINFVDSRTSVLAVRIFMCSAPAPQQISILKVANFIRSNVFALV
jgi:hypothetical protein